MGRCHSGYRRIEPLEGSALVASQAHDDRWSSDWYSRQIQFGRSNRSHQKGLGARREEDDVNTWSNPAPQSNIGMGLIALIGVIAFFAGGQVWGVETDRKIFHSPEPSSSFSPNEIYVGDPAVNKQRRLSALKFQQGIGCQDIWGYIVMLDDGSWCQSSHGFIHNFAREWTERVEGSAVGDCAIDDQLIRRSLPKILNCEIRRRMSVNGHIFERAVFNENVSSQFFSALFSSIEEEKTSKDSYHKGKERGQKQEQRFWMGNCSSSHAASPKKRFRQWIGAVFALGIVALGSSVFLFRNGRWYGYGFSGLFLFVGFCCLCIVLMGIPFWI
jgi:hypothetical protein